MRKVNIEKKVDIAIDQLIKAYRYCNYDDPVYQSVVKYFIQNALSYLCMTDDYVVEEKSTYYCLSEIDRNVGNFLEERKRKSYENGNK